MSRHADSPPLNTSVDFAARPEHCGAPVVGATGRVVGLLIARAQLVESLVIPASEIKASLERLIQRGSAGP